MARNCIEWEGESKMTEMITVIVPVYNAEKTIERCTRSIMTQSYQNLEILLIDDGSPDRSGEICDRLARQDKRISVIHTPNGGAAKARNIGLDIAKGNYIGFVDSDDYVDSQMYEILLKCLKEEKVDVACVGMVRENQDGSNQQIIRCPKHKMVLDDRGIIQEILMGRYVGSSLCTKLYRRECWNRLRLPEGETNEDTKVTFDLYEKRKMVHTAKAMYHYTINENGVTHTLTYDNLLTTYNNSMDFLKRTEQSYPEIKNAAIFYMADTAKVILMQENITPETKLYRDCKIILDKYHRVLGRDWRAFLLRMNWYHAIKKVMKGIRRE